jgi:hypothetical protein
MNKFISSAMLIAAGGTSIGSGRLVPTVAAVVGLVGAVIGGLALARSAVESALTPGDAGPSRQAWRG